MSPAKAFRRPTRRLVVAVATAVTVVLGAGLGTAYAYFTATGQGAGSVSTGTLSGVSLLAVSSSDSPASMLLPGAGTPSNPGPGVAGIVLRIKNDNAFSVSLTTFTPSGTLSVSGGNGCTAANSAVTFLSKGGLSVTVPSGTNDVQVPLAVEMRTSSNSGCQGAYFSTDGSIQVQR